MKNFASAILFASCLFMSGCGGSSPESESRPGTGRMSISIRWPDLTREIPAATRSIRLRAVELTPKAGGGLVEDEELQTKTVTRPGDEPSVSTTVFDLPAGDVRIIATAHATSNGTGATLASGSTDVKIEQSATATATIVLSGAIERVVLTPTALDLERGQQTTIRASARDSEGNIVPVPSEEWTFTSSDPSVAGVLKNEDPNGHFARVDAIAVGTASVRATHRSTGIFAETNVRVVTQLLVPSYMTKTFVGQVTFSGFPIEDGGSFFPNGTFDATVSFDTSRLVAPDPRDRVAFMMLRFNDGSEEKDGGFGILPGFTNNQYTFLAFFSEDDDGDGIPEIVVTGTGRISVSNGVMTLNAGASGFGRSGRFVGTAPQ